MTAFSEKAMRNCIPCIKCNRIKSTKHFYHSTIRKSGNRGECKSCVIDRVHSANQKPHRLTWYTSEKFKMVHRGNFQRYIAQYPMRREARSITYNAIRRGELVRASKCENCGKNQNIEAHHDDYNKPMSIRWLCKNCHGEWHRYNTPVYPKKLV